MCSLALMGFAKMSLLLYCHVYESVRESTIFLTNETLVLVCPYTFGGGRGLKHFLLFVTFNLFKITHRHTYKDMYICMYVCVYEFVIYLGSFVCFVCNICIIQWHLTNRSHYLHSSFIHTYTRTLQREYKYQTTNKTNQI